MRRRFALYFLMLAPIVGVACGLDVLGTPTVGVLDAAAPDGMAPPLDAPPTPTTEDAADADAADDADADAGAEADAADAGLDAALACPETGPCDRVIFVTNDKFAGDLAGVAGADAICRKLAVASPLAALRRGPFVAWIADEAGAPATRLNRRGRFVLADGRVLAESWADLVDGTIAHFVEVSEDGGIITIDDDDVWTGVKSDGTLAPTSCSAWRSGDAGENGWIGLVARTSSSWTEARTDACDEKNHLYCVEQ